MTNHPFTRSLTKEEWIASRQRSNECDKFEWEYVARINVAGYIVLPVWADNKEDAKDIASNEIFGLLPSWCTVEVEGVKKADPPSMRFFLRNIERTDGDDE